MAASSSIGSQLLAGADWRPAARGDHPLATASEWADNMSTAQRQAANALGVSGAMRNLMTGGGGPLPLAGRRQAGVESIFCCRQRLYAARAALQAGAAATNGFQRVYLWPHRCSGEGHSISSDDLRILCRRPAWRLHGGGAPFGNPCSGTIWSVTGQGGSKHIRKGDTTYDD